MDTGNEITTVSVSNLRRLVTDIDPTSGTVHVTVRIHMGRKKGGCSYLSYMAFACSPTGVDRLPPKEARRIYNVGDSVRDCHPLQRFPDPDWKPR